MKIGKYEIFARCWPWQKGYDWRGAKDHHRSTSGTRFGQQDTIRLGISIGPNGADIYLVFGLILIKKTRS